MSHFEKGNSRASTKKMESKIDFLEINNPLLKYLGNPLLGAYWFIVRRLI